MELQTVVQQYASISQRALISYLRALADLPPGSPPDRRDLRAFLQALYQAAFDQPDAFGMPTKPDFAITDQMPDRTNQLALANRQLDPARKTMSQGIDFLRAVGAQGMLAEDSLALPAELYSQLVKTHKVGRKFLQGLAQVGLEITPGPQQVTVTSTRFPAMLPGLQTLARACARLEPEHHARFLFARADFGALQPGYQPDVLDLYRVFPPEAQARLAKLHAYLALRGYKPIQQVYGTHAWDVKYQGSRKIKGSPLFQVEYQERCENPLRLQIKCAAAGRIAGLMPHQPRALQEDFFRRANRCNGAKCGWCKNRKGLGPSLLEFEDARATICWYVNPDIFTLDDSVVELVQQYVDLHEQLLPLN